MCYLNKKYNIQIPDQKLMLREKEGRGWSRSSFDQKASVAEEVVSKGNGVGGEVKEVEQTSRSDRAFHNKDSGFCSELGGPSGF